MSQQQGKDFWASILLLLNFRITYLILLNLDRLAGGVEKLK